ncbi:MAG: hypothetical protein EHM35_08635, partial [Planctomycetaceae bacterium]
MRDDPWKTLGVMILILVTGAYVTSAQNDAASQILFDFGPGFNVSAVETSDVKATLTDAGALRVETGRAARWPGVTLKAPQGKWDLSACEYI